MENADVQLETYICFNNQLMHFPRLTFETPRCYCNHSGECIYLGVSYLNL